MRTLRVAWVVVTVGCVLLPPDSTAQTSVNATLAGVVKDATGAVLPGVTVEAGSPALIEKVRSAVTDAQGQYRIVDLRPGVYEVTFTLTGFSTVKHPDIELTSGFTATVNGDMRVGSLQETITVTGATPLVDVQNVRAQRVISRQVLEALPSAKDFTAFAALTPGAYTTGLAAGAVGGNKGEGNGQLQIHGAGGGEGAQDGMHHASPISTGTGRGYFTSSVTVQEVVLYSQASAETEWGGLNVNVITKDGGDTVSGVISTAYTGRGLQNSNLNDELRARNVTTPNSVNNIYDLGGGIGGPLKRGKVWFYGAARTWGAEERVAGLYFNKLAPETLFYEPDLDRPALFRNNYYDTSLKVTMQIAQKHKITVSDSQQYKCNCYIGLGGAGTTATAVRTPEATSHSAAPWHGSFLAQVNWTYPATNRLLLEAGWGERSQIIYYERPDEVAASARSVVDLGLGLEYGSKFQGPGSTGSQWLTEQGLHGRQTRDLARFAVSYITGSHALKVGFSKGWVYQPVNAAPNFPVQYTFLNRVPVGLTQIAAPHHQEDRLRAQDAIYAQDQWTLRRVTLNLGMRVDYLNAYAPAQTRPASEFLPEYSFDELKDVPNWKDFNPRLGLAYDLFGNARTAIKATIGRYVLPEALSVVQALNPVSAISTITTRTWNDTNGNYVPDCELGSPLSNGECGAMANQAFGTIRPITQYADDVLRGTGVRPYTWQASASVQHELRANTSVTVGYFRTWYGNFRVTDNRAVTSADYDPYCVTVPTDARLPGGGGGQLCGAFDIDPSKFGQVTNVVTRASNFGEQTQVYNGVDVTLNARLGRGRMLTGGISVGRTVTDDCDVIVDSPQKLFCHVAPPWSRDTSIKFAGVYPLPWGLQASAVYQNLSGIVEGANVVYTNAQVAPSLGRSLAACGTRVPCTTTQVLSVAAPGEMAEPRQNLVDVRLAKSVRVKGLRLQPWFDTYNIFNASPVLRVNNTFGTSWLRPTDLLSGRLFKFGADVNF